MIETPYTRCACRTSVRALLTALAELARLRIALLVLAVTAAGFFLALAPDEPFSNFTLLGNVLLGTALIAAGANTLNQAIEAEYDALMVRTMSRPIPSRRITRAWAAVFGVVSGFGGVGYLFVFANATTGTIGAVTLAGYVLLYTPLKRVSWTSVFVGAVPGALPPVIGWTAATGAFDARAWTLFGILYVWQLPHFAAIAWLHREDYRRAGYPTLATADANGLKLCRHMMAGSIVLLAVSLLPVFLRLSGGAYAAGAVLLGVTFMAFGAWFCVRRTRPAARLHLFASVAYLPALFGAMLVDKVSP